MFSLALLISIKRIKTSNDNRAISLCVYVEFITFLSHGCDSNLYCSGIEHILTPIPAVIFVSCRIDLLMFTRSSVFPREKLRCIIGLRRRHFRYFSALMYQIIRVSGPV